MPSVVQQHGQKGSAYGSGRQSAPDIKQGKQHVAPFHNSRLQQSTCERMCMENTCLGCWLWRRCRRTCA